MFSSLGELPLVQVLLPAHLNHKTKFSLFIMKYTINKLYIVNFLAFAMLTIAGCSDSNSVDNETPEPDLYNLGEFTDNGITVTAYANAHLQVGYNEIFLDVQQNGDRMQNTQFRFVPMMHMEAHSHASPFEIPGSTRDNTHNLHAGWVIFTMPSGMMGSWELQITAEIPSNPGIEVTGIIPIDVEASNRVKTFMTENQSRYVLTWIEPTTPQVGLNNLIISLHKRESMMSFPPVLNAVFDFEPWMPSMDHGSSNNVHPIHNGNGFYTGKVNFNMTGDWELRFQIEIEGHDAGSHIFELDF